MEVPNLLSDGPRKSSVFSTYRLSLSLSEVFPKFQKRNLPKNEKGFLCFYWNLPSSLLPAALVSRPSASGIKQPPACSQELSGYLKATFSVNRHLISTDLEAA